METQHTAYRLLSPIPITYFVNLTPNKFNVGSNWLENVWKLPNEVSIWDCISIWDRSSDRIRSVFGMGRSIFGIEAEIEVDKI